VFTSALFVTYCQLREIYVIVDSLPWREDPPMVSDTAKEATFYCFKSSLQLQSVRGDELRSFPKGIFFKYLQRVRGDEPRSRQTLSGIFDQSSSFFCVVNLLIYFLT